VKNLEIAPAKGKLGILLVGLGAVSTTTIAGVLAVRKGLANPIGSLTQMGTIRLGKRTEGRSPKINEVVPLSDLDKPEALFRYARARGFRLGEDVIRYLLAHGRRDMGTLVRVLGALDRHSLAAKRAITVPMLRQWLQRDLPWRGE